MQETSNSKAKVVTAIVVIAAVALIYFFSSGHAVQATKTSGLSDAPLSTTSQGSQSGQSSQSSSSGSSGSSGSSNSTMGPGQMGSGMTYKAGTYSDTEQYRTPESYESIKVQLAVAADGTVTGASVSQSGTNRTSASYQQDFQSQYKQYVVGKKIRDINMQYVSGSSLTSAAFDQALSQIASQAQG